MEKPGKTDYMSNTTIFFRLKEKYKTDLQPSQKNLC